MADGGETFALLAGVNTVAATPAEQSRKNIEINLARGFPRLHQMPEFQRIKGMNVPIAIVGGGPSLKRTIGELEGFRHIIAAGSAHDYLRSQGVTPEYTVVCDPDPVMANYLRNPSSETKYLLSSHCDDSVFVNLAGMSIALWHCGPVDEELLNRIDPGWHAVGGGCTVGLRAISIAIVLGYQNIHLFGFDSCLSDDESEHHAYEFTDSSEDLGDIYSVKLGLGTNGPNEGAKTYRCAGYQMAQADHFKLLVQHFGHIFEPTFHGDGLLPAMWKQIKEESQKITPKEEEGDK